jgi:hypothetical protein
MMVIKIPPVHIDANTFQRPLDELAEVIAQKALREGSKCIAGPDYVTFDLFILIRHALTAYRFFSWVNADEHTSDYRWKDGYTVMALSSVRTMIDCLYNILAILENPPARAVDFRLNGFDKKMKALNDEKARYGNDPAWDDHISERGTVLRLGIRQSQFDPDAMPKFNKWKTLGQFIGDQPAQDTELQHFLRTFTLGKWREYSQVSHATFDGLTAVGILYQRPHAAR